MSEESNLHFDVKMEHVEAILEKLDELNVSPEQEVGILMVALTSILASYEPGDIEAVTDAIREMALNAVII